MADEKAAGASEGQAEPIYQIRSTNSGTWHDVDKERYYSTRFERRIVYTHDLNNLVLALKASLYLKDAELTALRERVAGMEKDARRNAELIEAALRAAKRFIENGMEFGYIRMPTVDHDPANYTLPTICDALAAIAKEKQA